MTVPMIYCFDVRTIMYVPSCMQVRNAQRNVIHVHDLLRKARFLIVSNHIKQITFRTYFCHNAQVTWVCAYAYKLDNVFMPQLSMYF